MYILDEDLVMMEHDFLRKKVKETRARVANEREDYYAVASDFLVFTEAINDFVSELMGDAEDNEDNSKSE